MIRVVCGVVQIVREGNAVNQRVMGRAPFNSINCSDWMSCFLRIFVQMTIQDFVSGNIDEVFPTLARREYPYQTVPVSHFRRYIVVTVLGNIKNPRIIPTIQLCYMKSPRGQVLSEKQLTATLLLSCADRKGLVSRISHFILEHGGNNLELLLPNQ